MLGDPVARSIEAVGCKHLSHLSEVVADADVIDVWPLTDIASIEEIEIGEGAEVGRVERCGELYSQGFR